MSVAASGILFGQIFMQDKLCNNSESGEMEHHHQVRHVAAAQSSIVGAPPPFAQFWVASTMSHPLDGPLHLPKCPPDRPAAPTCRSQTEIVDCGGRRCKSLSARDAFQTRPRLLSVCCLQLPPLFYPCSNMTFKMSNLSHRNRCQSKDAKHLSNMTLTNITCFLFLLPRKPRTVGPQAQLLFQADNTGRIMRHQTLDSWAPDSKAVSLTIAWNRIDEFSENFRRGEGGSFPIQKISSQNF